MNALVSRNPYDPIETDSTERRPLATAEWLRSKFTALKSYTTGDIWVGRLETGQGMGARDDRHISVSSGTRGGKGVSVVITNLIVWPGSVVVIDPKGENALVTARRRANGSKYCHGMGQKVRILDPFDVVRTAADDFADLKCAYNPMSAISADREDSVDIAARIADSLIVSDSSESFFDDAAKGLVKAIILHVATSGDFDPVERTLVTVRRCIMAGDYKARANLIKFANPETKIPSGHLLLANAMMKNRAFGRVVADAGARLKDLENSPRTLASVIQVAATNTDFIDSPGMKRCLAQSSVTLSELKTDLKGVSLFITLPQRYMETHYRWLRMMTALIVGEMEQVKGQPANGHRLLMILEEFPALKRMRVIENAAAQIAGFGVKLMFVTQTLAQLKDLYKENWETLLANAGIKQFFFNDDHFTRKYVSDLIGDCEVVRTARSSSTSKSSSFSRSQSSTNSSSSGNSWGYSHGTSGAATNMSSSNGGNAGFSYARGSGETVSENWSTTKNVTDSIQKRPLVTPDEVGRMFSGNRSLNALLLVSGYQPLTLRRTPYYCDDMFAGLFDPHPDHPLPLTLVELAAKRRRDEQARLAREAHERRVREDRERKVEAFRAELAAEELRTKALEERYAALQKQSADEAAARKAKIERRRAVLRLVFWNAFVQMTWPGVVLFVGLMTWKMMR